MGKVFGNIWEYTRIRRRRRRGVLCNICMKSIHREGFSGWCDDMIEHLEMQLHISNLSLKDVLLRLTSSSSSTVYHPLMRMMRVEEDWTKWKGIWSYVTSTSRIHLGQKHPSSKTSLFVYLQVQRT